MFRELYGRETCGRHCVGQFETQAYTASDAIITVAASGKRHVKSLTGVRTPRSKWWCSDCRWFGSGQIASKRSGLDSKQ